MPECRSVSKVLEKREEKKDRARGRSGERSMKKEESGIEERQVKDNGEFHSSKSPARKEKRN